MRKGGIRVKRIATFVVFVLLSSSPVFAQLADTPWPMFRRDLRHSGLGGYAGPSRPFLTWSYRGGEAIYASPSIGFGGRVVAAFEAPLGKPATICTFFPDGFLEWSYATGSRWHRSSPAVSRDGDIVIGTSDFKVLAIKSDGTLRWTYRTESNVNSSPVIGNNGRVYVGSSDNRIYALDSTGALAWSYETGGPVESSPLLGNDGTVYVGSNDNNIYAIRSNGTRYWTFRTGDDVYSSPALGFNTVYAGSNDGRVYALHWTGLMRWTYLTGPGGAVYVHSSPALGGDETVYTGSSPGRFYALYSNGSLR